MPGSHDNVRPNQVLDFTPPDDRAADDIRWLSQDNGLGSLKLGDLKGIGSAKDDSSSKSGSDNLIDLNKPLDLITSNPENTIGAKQEYLTSRPETTVGAKKEYITSRPQGETAREPDVTFRPNDADGSKSLPTDANKPPSVEHVENPNTVAERGETSLDLKFDSYDLPDGGKLLVGKSDHKDLAFKPVILDKDGKFVRNTGGGSSGGTGPNGERLPESRGNSYSNGASDRYTEGDDKYQYTDANGKEHTIQLKDKISFKEPAEPDVELPEKEPGPELKFDPTRSLEDNLKQGFPPEMGETIKAKSYDLPDGDKLVTWEMQGHPMHPLVMQKNGDTFMVRSGGGGGGGGGVDADGKQYSTPRQPNEQMFSNGAVGRWHDGSSSYTYTDKSGNSIVLELSNPMGK